MTNLKRRIALALAALLLVPIAAIFPATHEDAVDATQFTIAFVAALLTGEAVIFAMSFSAASAWPALRSVDSHIAFREWVFMSGLATLFIAGGLLTSQTFSFTYGAMLFLLVGVLGAFSFVRLFGLASIGGRNRLLRSVLADGLRDVERADLGNIHALSDDPAVASYLSAVDQALSGHDPNSIRYLTSQLADPSVSESVQPAAVALHLEVLHRLTRAVLVSHADPVVVADCAKELVASVVRLSRTLTGRAPALGALSRQLAWLSSTALLTAIRNPSTMRGAREMIAMATDSRMLILRAVDPEPETARDAGDLGSVLGTPAEHAAWVADFCEHHGSAQAVGFFAMYQQMTGKKFLGNYRDGDSVLGRLRAELYGPQPARTPEADAARQFFVSCSEFDRYWVLASVAAISTLRDARVHHPPQLIRTEFSPDPQLLGEYLSSFATHRWFETAHEARQVLLILLTHADTPESPREQIRRFTHRHRFATPAPNVVPLERPAAMVLAVACRLAPLEPGGDDRELRAFLASLPKRTREAAASLAARTLPDAGDVGDEVDAVVQGFTVLQLVGSHTRSNR